MIISHSDADIWNILEIVDLKDVVNSLPGKLLELVSESGDNFSAGQRQVCMVLFLYVRLTNYFLMKLVNMYCESIAETS